MDTTLSLILIDMYQTLPCLFFCYVIIYQVLSMLLTRCVIHTQTTIYKMMCPNKLWTLKEAEIYAINGGILQLQLHDVYLGRLQSIIYQNKCFNTCFNVVIPFIQYSLF